MSRLSDDLSDLVLACARAARDTDPQELQRRASLITDWMSVRDAASAHSVLPLLAARLRQAQVTLTDVVAGTAASLAARNLRLASSVVAVRGMLASKGIETLAFKGPALSATLYGDPALRQSTDIDLLVRRREALPARRVLQAAGFRFWLDLSHGQEDRFLRYSNEYGLQDEEGGIVELSWALTPRHFTLELDADRFFPDARAIEMAGDEVRVLAPHDLLLALAIHGGKHLWERLGWVTDIAQLLATNPDLDVDRAIARARSVDAERLLLVAPALARMLIGVELPSTLADAIRGDPAATRIAERLAARLLPLTGRHHDRVLDPLTLRLRERGRDRASIVARLALTPTVEDWQWIRLPEPLAFAYPAVRPFRLAKKYLFS